MTASANNQIQLKSPRRIIFLILGVIFSLSFVGCGVLLLFCLDGWQKLAFIPQVSVGALFLQYFIRKYGQA
jgi:hypothetical protein